MPTTPRRRLPARVAKGFGLGALALIILGVTFWGALVLAFAFPGGELIRRVAASVFCLLSAGALIALFMRRRRRQAIGVFALLWAVPIVVWTSIEPTNDRDWQPDVAVLAYADISGDQVTVHNIRNFDYRSETDYGIAYYDKTFDLRQLQSVDIVTSYWMGPAIAHVFVSFGFAGDDYLAISIEVRKSRGKDYSTLRGFFRQYELIYVVADERDVIRLRTNYRHDPPEEVYLYRGKSAPEASRRLFLQYMTQLNALRDKPEFYNTLTTNCTTNVWTNASVNPGRVPMSWKILASGYVPEYLYEESRLDDMGLSFPDLQRRVHVNERARAADAAADFSRRIRT